MTRKKPLFRNRGKNRVRVVFLPIGETPRGAGWFIYSGNATSNTWHKPVILPRKES